MYEERCGKLITDKIIYQVEVIQESAKTVKKINF